MRILIKNGTIVNEGIAYNGNVLIDGDIIEAVLPADENPRGTYDKVVDAAGCLVLPGVIDTHVHFREPGLTHKADIESESRAAAYGGVTTYFDMPNTNPQTTTLAALDEKFGIAAAKSHVNYSFFFGATNDNTDSFSKLDTQRIPGIKLFMGSSTGNMLVDKDSALQQVFLKAKALNLPVMAHCEDTDIINANMAACKSCHGEDPDVIHHPSIRSEEACYRSTSKACQLAAKTGAHLHVAHITTARELELIKAQDNVTAEATVAHLLFSDKDYAKLGTRIKCNPAIKTEADRDALRRSIADGTIMTIGTDHAPHALSEKEGGAAKAVSGMPMLQFSLIAMLSLVDEGILSAERLVELMCHNPARLFNIRQRGFIRPGYKADIVIAKRDTWTITNDDIQSKCKWSPVEGRVMQWRVMHTFCNGSHLLNNGTFDNDSRGEAVSFR